MADIVLFDLDGTLTDPWEGITRCVQYGMEAAGHHEPDRRKLTPFIGPPLMDMFMGEYGFTKERAELAVEKYRERFGEKGMFENEIYEGIEDMLKALRNSGRRLGVATSKPEVFAVPILEHFHIDSYFEQIVGSELSGERVRKGDVIREALRRFDVEEAQEKPVVGGREELVWMVGDRKYDVIGAREAGIPCVGVLYGYGGHEELSAAGADRLVSTVAELRELLLAL